MYLHYQIPSNSVATVASNVISIDSCAFSNGVDLSGGPPITSSSGLSMFFYDTVKYKLNVSIRNVISTKNIAEGGANFLFYLFGDHRVESIKIMNITSSMANCLLLHKKHVAGFELYYHIPGVLDPSPHRLLMGLFCTYVSDSKFYDNIGGGITIQLYKDHSNTKYQVIIKNCSFQENLNVLEVV